MFTRTAIIVVLAACLLLTGSVVAGSKAERIQDRQEIRQDLANINHTQTTLEALEHAVDLWHDANLKHDKELAKKYMVQIEVIIQNDIDHARKAVKAAQKEKNQSYRERTRRHATRGAKADDVRDHRDDVRDAGAWQDVYKLKKRLMVSIKRGEAFSNRYRLLGDYADVLRKEVNMNRVELAEDHQELREDRKR